MSSIQTSTICRQALAQHFLTLPNNPTINHNKDNVDSIIQIYKCC